MKRLLLAFLPLMLLLAAGCWNYTEVENLTIISGMSVDYEGGVYRLRAEIIDLSGTGNSSSEYTASFLESEGVSISQAVSLMGSKVGRRLYWDHAEVYIISKSVAENGISDLIDWFLHENLVRLTSLVVVADTEKASDIFESEALKGKSIAFALEDMLVSYGESGEHSVSRIYSLINLYHNVGTATFIPMVGGRDNAGSELMEITGMAVFLNDIIADEYDLDQTKSIFMLRGGNSWGEYEVDVDGEVRVSVKCRRNFVDIKTDYENGIPKAIFSVKAELSLTGLSDDTYKLDAETLKHISECTEEQIKKEIEAVLQKDIRGAGADIGGVGIDLQQKRPALWKELAYRWRDIYPSLEYTIEVSADIGVSGQASYLTEGLQ